MQDDHKRMAFKSAFLEPCRYFLTQSGKPTWYDVAATVTPTLFRAGLASPVSWLVSLTSGCAFRFLQDD